MLLSLKDSSVLENKLIVKTGNTDLDAFIPADLTIADIVSDDLYLTSWDINHRTPRFFN